MKKLLAVLGTTIALVAAQPVQAQTAIGLRAGATISDLSVDSEADDILPDLDTRTGFVAGVFMDIPLSGGVLFQPGVSYAQKGAELNEAGESLGINLDYVEIPLLFKYAFPTSGPVGVHLSAGPAVAFEAKCELSGSAEGVDVTIDCDDLEGTEIELETKSLDLGAMVGGGLAFGMGRASLLVDIFYNFGLLDIDDFEGDETKNRALYLTAGVSFPVGG